MEPTEKELEDRLRVLGMRLASPPPNVDELLYLLDQTEIYLSRVDQSPSSSMSDALRPVMYSLTTKEILNHPEADVKVFVAACINEIIRITAPDAPYNDTLMKEIFATIVGAFEKLDDMSGCLYSKRVSILEIMAKVRSCVVMLDLECDDLILHMFKYFLKGIRPDHPINVFSSMEAIMTLILEESDNISPELLIYLLSIAQKPKKGVIPVARRLAEKVISNCLMKLKPYILVAVQSMGICLDDYGDIVAFICKDNSITLEQNEADDNKLSRRTRTVSDELPQESEKLDKPINCLEEVGAFADTTIKMLSIGFLPLGNGHAVIEPISPELEPESSFSNEQCINDAVPRDENNSLDSITEIPDGDKETSTPTGQRNGLDGQAKSLKSDSVSGMVPETKMCLESEREAELQLLEGLVGDNPCVNSAAPTYSSPGRCLPSHFSEKKSTSHKPATTLAGKKRSSEITAKEKEDPTDVVSEHKDQRLVSISDGKSLQDSAKLSLAENAMAKVGTTGISDGRSLRTQQKEAASVVADANTFENQQEYKIKWPKAEDVTDKDASAEPCLKEMMVSSKSPREANNDQSNQVKFARGRPTKKHRRKASRSYNMHLDNIGREIEVWWPDDKKFYKGVIDAFDPVTEKHKVVYDDGDVEILFLRNERWNYIDSKNFEREQENDIAGPESTFKMPKKLKASSRRRKAARERSKLSRKSEESGDPKSTFKSRGSPRQTTSELDTSLYEKTSESLVNEETKFDSDKPSEYTSITKDNNTFTKFKSDRRFKRKHISTSSGPESLIRSMGGPKGDSFGRKSKIFDKDEGTESDSQQIKLPTNENSNGLRISDVKFRENFSRILNEETLKSPSDGDKGTNIESSQTNNGLFTNTDEELKGKDTLSSDNIVSNSEARRKKRERTVITTDTYVSAIENLDDFSLKSAAKMNK